MHSVTDMLVLDVEERVTENTRTSELNKCGDGAATQLHICDLEPSKVCRAGMNRRWRRLRKAELIVLDQQNVNQIYRGTKTLNSAARRLRWESS